MDPEWNLHLHEWQSQIVGLFVFVSFFGWLVGLIGDCWLGFLLVWVSNLLKVGLLGLLGFNLLEMCFSGLRFFFFFFGLGWLCYIFGLIWYFGVLGFDHDFAGFEKSLPLSFMILFSSWNFLGFLCVCFLRKFLGLLVCLLGNNMIFMCWERKNVLTEKTNK